MDEQTFYPPKSGRPRRNWKRFISILFVAVIAFLVAMLVVTVVVENAMRSSEAYRIAIAEVKGNPHVTAVIGSPIVEGWFVTGNVNVTGPSGEADLAIPISGPRGRATVYVTGSKFAGEWRFSALVVQLERTQERVDLQEGGLKNIPRSNIR